MLHRVARVDRPLDGAGFAPTVRRLFTEAGAAEVLRIARRGAPSEGDGSPEASPDARTDCRPTPR